MQKNVVIIWFYVNDDFYSVVTQKQSAVMGGGGNKLMRGLNRMSVWAGGDGFEVCVDGWGWDQNPFRVQVSL